MFSNMVNLVNATFKYRGEDDKGDPSRCRATGVVNMQLVKFDI